MLAAFREHFVKPGLFSVQDSRAFGEAFQARNLTDYQTVGRADQTQVRTVLDSAGRFVEHCERYLAGKGCL